MLRKTGERGLIRYLEHRFSSLNERSLYQLRNYFLYARRKRRTNADSIYEETRTERKADEAKKERKKNKKGRVKKRKGSKKKKGSP